MIGLVCPMCHGVLELRGDCAHCGVCGHDCLKHAGVWRLLRPERVAPIERFLADYTRIRIAEGRGSGDADFYRNLPACSAKHPLAWQWRIHSRTWQTFHERVLPQLADRAAPLRILDLGAGTGWLSHRLALLGHEPCAVDLSCDDQDGLAAALHFAAGWPCVQAEFDHLPLADASVDLVIFNASLHYSTNYYVTVREALRVLAPGGCIAVLETPVYVADESGRQMVRERRTRFLKQHGTASDSMPSQQYLTWAGIHCLGERTGVTFRYMRPWYGVRWALKPLLARLRGRREPGQFPILIGRKVACS